MKRVAYLGAEYKVIRVENADSHPGLVEVHVYEGEDLVASLCLSNPGQLAEVSMRPNRRIVIKQVE